MQKTIPYVVGKTSDVSLYEENRKLLCESLEKIGYDVVWPKGAFYLFIKALEDDAVAFSNNAKKHELLIVPSNDFGVKGYVRISYCVDKNVIVNSIPAFGNLFKDYSEK